MRSHSPVNQTHAQTFPGTAATAEHNLGKEHTKDKHGSFIDQF